VQEVPLTFRRNGGGYDVQVDGGRILRAATRPILGENDKPMWVENVPFVEGTRWVLGKAKLHRYQDPKDPAWAWDHSGRNGAWCNFSWDWVNRG
jgi:hypothetical protein